MMVNIVLSKFVFVVVGKVLRVVYAVVGMQEEFYVWGRGCVSERGLIWYIVWIKTVHVCTGWGFKGNLSVFGYVV